MATNRLAQETSPYLLQHAHNPVDWYPWGKEALARAKHEDKPILVSIGYSACHWCHVMERESFEQEEIAAVMNAHFVCIKVDREERPDVDAIYMDAVQAMGLQGGWPLNVILTPDAKPFYGGTYFPPRQWVSLLEQIAEAYGQQKDQLLASAEKFTEDLAQSESRKYGLEAGDPAVVYRTEELEAMFGRLANGFDRKRGGMNKAPKFPMPSIYFFLLRYHQLTQQADALDQAKLTLNQMAFGGIYDQVGGGFARYSVDAEWFAPHFEKMLYDNGQLISLYTEAYALTKEPLYKAVVYQTIAFVARELTNAEGGFYSALDADSEGEEGKFYVWTKAELDAVLGSDSEWFGDYYHVKDEGNWEHGKNILYRTQTEEEFARRQNLSAAEVQLKLGRAHATLMQTRAQRVRPGLDDKVLCSWNALMLKGLTDAYRVFGEADFLNMATRNAAFLRSRMRNGEQLWHTYKDGRASLPGYLEDYAAVIEAYTHLYQATFEAQWLREADQLTQYVVENFYDAEEELFFFTDARSEPLIARKKELFDNVIPASNSVMATNLYFLGQLLDKPSYRDLSDRMLARVKKLLLGNGQYLANWACLFTYRVRPTVEIAIVGEDYLSFRREFDQSYFPNKVLVGAAAESELPLLEDRYPQDGRTTVYVCYNKACQRPVYQVADAWAQVEEGNKQ
ncbi:MAG: thioredoxin domain-containing protein [Ferruginibacter sp.]|nr:thioredoxin domain-containing protein [Cytophagales bacterium]